MERLLRKQQPVTKGYYQKCPVCGIYLEYVTNAHCTIEHNMTKKEVEGLYGEIDYVKRKVNKPK